MNDNTNHNDDPHFVHGNQLSEQWSELIHAIKTEDISKPVGEWPEDNIPEPLLAAMAKAIVKRVVRKN